MPFLAQKRPASFAQDFLVAVQLDLLYDMHALVFMPGGL